MKQQTKHSDARRPLMAADQSGQGARQDEDASKRSWGSEQLAAFEDRLRHLRLTPSQQSLASVVLDNPQQVAMSTIHALAGELGVNESTISRFTAALDLSGYAELRSVCRALANRHSGMLWRFMRADHGAEADSESGANRSEGDGKDLAGKNGTSGQRERRDILAAQDSSSIAASFARIDGVLWDEVVTRLAHAEHIAVIGLRQSQAVAAMFAYLLGLVRSQVSELSAGGARYLDALRDLGPHDCLFAIATQPCSKDTVNVAQWAKSHGVPVIALTDEVLGPLAELADQVLIAGTESDSVLSSMTALVSMVQALANDVAAVDAAGTRAHLERQESLLKSFGAYADKDL